MKNVVRGDRRGNQHVTGPELLEGVRQYAIDQFGCLAHVTLGSWGVGSTDDFGEIVFNLVDHDLMGKQDSDTKEDFQGLYEFDEVFEVSPLFSYEPEKGEWRTAYIARSHYCPQSQRDDSGS